MRKTDDSRNMARRSPKNRPKRPLKQGSRSQKRERKDKRQLARESSDPGRWPEQTPEQRQAVEKLLEGIGVPKPSPFKPDDFQLEALEAIESEDVLVTAPTGSGKTWIAREEIRRLLAEGRRAWYTTPLKALSNSKYAEFSEEFGPDNVGILTGDRKENWDAPLIVGTTEIYRNQLFDALRQGGQVGTDLVILDEAHYLSDDDRGHVWEESIILTPPRIRMLLLSATVGKAEDLAGWIGRVRGTTVRVINRAGTRPVELRAAYMSSNRELYPLFDREGRFNSEIEKFTRERNRGFRQR
ncbi:MAG TPA: DEAD/DEAH box helicase [Pyrinomonadaceae bacterium]|nr:DEAD/DEAH box helicase [Pyrinomonadaceae bacterium]HMP66695.1 DEAD/DEAH box helicase [Pyrinomonadaceae bacterium]